LSEFFGAGAGDAAGAAGAEEAAVPAAASLDFVVSLFSEGFVSVDESEEDSELFGA